MKAVLGHYDLGPIDSVTPLDSGYQSNNWLVTTAGARYVLKQLALSGADPETMMQLLDWLAEAGVPVPPPVRTRAGHWHVKESGGAWVLNGFLSGTPIPDDEIDRRLERVGRALGALHRAGCEVSQAHPGALNGLGPSPDRALPLWFEPWTGPEAWVASSYAKFREDLAQVRTELTQGPLNGDLGPHSLFFEGDRLSGVLDFGAACHWFLMFDLASCLMYIGGDRAERATERRALLEGYLATAPVEPRQLEHIPLFLRCRALIQIGYFRMRLEQGITQGNDDAENRRGYANGIAMLERAEAS